MTTILLILTTICPTTQPLSIHMRCTASYITTSTEENKAFCYTVILLHLQCFACASHQMSCFPTYAQNTLLKHLKCSVLLLEWITVARPEVATMHYKTVIQSSTKLAGCNGNNKDLAQENR